MWKDMSHKRLDVFVEAESSFRVFNHFCRVAPQSPLHWAVLQEKADKNLFMTFALELWHPAVKPRCREQDQSCLWSKVRVFHISHLLRIAPLCHWK